MVKTPILFETFTRVDYARKVFDAIKAAQPRKLYFYSDKGRADHPGEIEKNDEIRSWVKEVDWDCELHTLFLEEWLPVDPSLRTAMNWVFDNEPEAIILEDDCLPSPAFFQYVDCFIDKYRDDKRINFITGNNYSRRRTAPADADHVIGRSIHHFGWATWSDRWKAIDFDITVEELLDQNAFVRYFKGDYILGKYYETLYRRHADFIRRTKCWDYVKVLNQIRNQQLAVVPLYNLVQNVGLYGVHYSGKAVGREFECSNGAEHGDYPLTGNPVPVVPDLRYEVAESQAEGFRRKGKFLMNLTYRVRHLFKK